MAAEGKEGIGAGGVSCGRCGTIMDTDEEACPACGFAGEGWCPTCGIDHEPPWYDAGEAPSGHGLQEK